MLMKFYRYLNVLSLDVSLGAVVCSLFFGKILEVSIEPVVLLSLSLTVWIVYSVDHLLDSKMLKGDASSRRHLFHQRNFNTLTITVMVAIGLDFFLLYFIEQPVLNWGFLLATGVIVYLFASRWLAPLKEVIAALLYSAGIVMPGLSLTNMSINYVLLGSFIITVLINLILFSWFDEEADRRDEQSSITTYFNRIISSRLLSLLFLLQSGLILYLLIFSAHRIEALVFGLMNSVLSLLYLFPGVFKKNEGYRLAGDFIFFFPLLYLMCRG